MGLGSRKSTIHNSSLEIQFDLITKTGESGSGWSLWDTGRCRKSEKSFLGPQEFRNGFWIWACMRLFLWVFPYSWNEQLLVEKWLRHRFTKNICRCSIIRRRKRRNHIIKNFYIKCNILITIFDRNKIQEFIRTQIKPKTFNQRRTSTEKRIK